MEHEEQGHLAAPSGDVPSASSDETSRPMTSAAPTEQETPSQPAQRFHLVRITTRGYHYERYMDSCSLKEACAQHIAAYNTLGFRSSALVMRGPDGRRYSVADSAEIATA